MNDTKPLLLDTCALIWMTDGGSQAAIDSRIEEAASGPGVYVSPISAWEIGMLASKGRLASKRDPQVVFREMVDGRLKLAPMGHGVLIASSFLPHCELRDPADRIIAATAREFGWELLTRDRPLLAYAAGGWLRAMSC